MEVGRRWGGGKRHRSDMRMSKERDGKGSSQRTRGKPVVIGVVK
jgi:hypothetical protein